MSCRLYLSGLDSGNPKSKHDPYMDPFRVHGQLPRVLVCICDACTYTHTYRPHPGGDGVRLVVVLLLV